MDIDKPPKKKQNWIKVQKPMLGVVYALVPAALFGIFNFGWRALVVIAVSLSAAILTEGAFTWRKGQPVTSAVLVTGLLFGMIMPPSIPLWIAIVGVVFAVVFGKMVFGGFGQNVYNPAMAGRCFVYVSFPVAMTAHWNLAADLFPRGLNNWLVDAVTGATPLAAHKATFAGDPSALASWWQQLFGFSAGCIGETSFVAVALGGAYILYKKYANWQTVAAVAGSATILQTVFWLTGVSAANPAYMLLSGGFALGTFFMATDPVSSANTDVGRIVYGSIIGVVTIVVRIWGNFAEGFMFGVLMGNTFAPIVDFQVREYRKKKKEAAKAAAAKAQGVTP